MSGKARSDHKWGHFCRTVWSSKLRNKLYIILRNKLYNIKEFDENPYFDNKKLEKDNGVTEDGDSESTWTEIKWKTEHIDFNKNCKL